MPAVPTTRRKLGNSGAQGDVLTKEQRGQAIAQVKLILDEVAVGWEYSLPVKKTKVLDVGRREGSLGSWRPSGVASDQEEVLVTDDDEDDDEDEDGEDEDDEDDIDVYGSNDYDDNEDPTRVAGGNSYRRATTPPPAPKKGRRARRKREGVWVKREDDSDVELNIVPPDKKGEEYVWEGPDDIPTPEKIRERQRLELEADMEWNVGLKLWVHRRDAWTQANEDGEIKICESRFKDNPLYAMVGPQAYDQIYTKVCMGGAQPPIPINLKHLNNALVEGWKREGPPKPSRPEQSIAVRKKKINAAVTATANTTVPNAAGPGKKGRDAVKKVLGF